VHNYDEPYDFNEPARTAATTRALLTATPASRHCGKNRVNGNRETS
jgi:hypothetical protein